MDDQREALNCKHCRHYLNSRVLPLLSKRYNDEREKAIKMAIQANHYGVLYRAAKAAIEQLKMEAA